MTIKKFTLLLPMALIFFLLSCNPKSSNKTGNEQVTDTAALLKLGDSITSAVQKVLLANVTNAMKSGGPSFAVTYCNQQAMPLTDSLAKKYNCLINRISDKYRNPANKPGTKEEGILATMLATTPMQPVLISESGKMIYYKPIKIAMPACLVCHGTAGREMDTKTMESILKLYPFDLATGYKEGDLRGMWKITFLED